MPTLSKEPYGLRATLDRLVYFRDPERHETDAPHAFIYFITIANLSNTTITLNGRRRELGWALYRQCLGLRTRFDGRLRRELPSAAR